MGFSASTSSKDLQSAYNQARQAMNTQINELIRTMNHATHIANIQTNLSFNHVSFKYLLLPVYTSCFTYNKKTFNIFVNGETGRTVGRLPVSRGKIWAAALVPALIIAAGFGLFFALM